MKVSSKWTDLVLEQHAFPFTSAAGGEGGAGCVEGRGRPRRWARALCLRASSWQLLKLPCVQFQFSAKCMEFPAAFLPLRIVGFVTEDATCEFCSAQSTLAGNLYKIHCLIIKALSSIYRQAVMNSVVIPSVLGADLCAKSILVNLKLPATVFYKPRINENMEKGSFRKFSDFRTELRFLANSELNLFYVWSCSKHSIRSIFPISTWDVS